MQFSIVLVVCLLASAASLSGARPVGSVPASQRQALVDLYQSSHGESWLRKDGWLSDDPCVNKWLGVTCDSANANVIRLELPNNRLSGSLPNSLSSLSALMSLFLKSNKLAGTVPASVANLPLTTLHLEDNLFSGNLDWVGNWTDLLYFEIQENAFTGTIPDMFYSMSKLKFFQVNSNALSGTLPASMVYMTNAEMVDVSDNQLTGVVYDGTNLTASVFNLPHVSEFYFENNHFTGGLPSTLPSYAKFTYVWGNNNQLSGTIPSWVCPLSSYNFAGNKFNCPLPDCCKQECDRGYVHCCGTCA